MAQENHVTPIDSSAHRDIHKDTLLMILAGIGYAAVATILIGLWMLWDASPDTFARTGSPLPAKYYWSPTLVQYLFYLSIFGAVLSSAGLYINSKRMKRNYDYIRMNLVFLWIVSVIGIVLYMAG